MAHTLHNSAYIADIKQVAFVLGASDLLDLLHATQCHNDPATDFYNLWQYLQCTYKASLDTEARIVNDCDSPSNIDFTYDAIMQQRAFVLHWVGHLTAKIQNHTLATLYPLQATYGLYQEDVAAFRIQTQKLREMAQFLLHLQPQTATHMKTEDNKKHVVLSASTPPTTMQHNEQEPMTDHPNKRSSKMLTKRLKSSEMRRSARLAKKRQRTSAVGC